MLLVIYSLYGLLAFGLFVLMRLLRILPHWRILAAFLLVGAASGLVGLAYWPEDSSVLFNPVGSWIGYAVYSGSISLIGDPHSAQAHYTIPWPLRIPQVCVISAVVVWGVVGVVVQVVRNYWKRIGTILGVAGSKT